MTQDEFTLRLAEIQTRVCAAARRSGRGAQEITILPVTKFVDAERMGFARGAGFMEFGENYVQPILAKSVDFPEIHWHMIGHLQKNKVKSILGKVCMLQSLDSPVLARALDQAYVREGSILDVLIQVNIGREPQKSGVLPEELFGLVQVVSACAGLRLAGLMAVPPAGAMEETRPFFSAMRRLHEELLRFLPQAGILSMGMSADYEAAIEEGSTMIRLGTVLFGSRPPITGGGKTYGEGNQ